MKKNEIEKLDEIEKQKKLNKETKDIILNKSFENLLIAVDILILFIALLVARHFLSRLHTELIYKISSILFLILTITTFEVAYKKKDKSLGIHGIEMMILSIIILYTPYMFLMKKTSISEELIGVYACIYYIIKITIIYFNQKSLYEKGTSDIQEIVKKESKDNINKERIKEEELKKAKEKEEKLIEEKKNNQRKTNENNQIKKKRGRPKKENIETKTKTENEDSTVDVKNVTTKKRGRPKKEDSIKQNTKETTKVEQTEKKRGRPKKEESRS